MKRKRQTNVLCDGGLKFSAKVRQVRLLELVGGPRGAFTQFGFRMGTNDGKEDDWSGVRRGGGASACGVLRKYWSLSSDLIGFLY